jgi:hypothetical protein
MNWFAAVAPKHDPSFLSQAWKILLAVAAILGLVAAIQQLLLAWRRRRYGAAVEERALKAAAVTLEAEAAKIDVDEWQNLRKSLRQQVEEEVPREARRVYLRSRGDALIRQIRADVGEFERLQSELAALAPTDPTELDARLRAVIETEINPVYSHQRRTDRAVVLLLAILVLSALSPVNPRFILYSFFDVMGSSTDYLVSGVVNAWLIGVLGVCSLVSVVALRRVRGPRSAWIGMRSRFAGPALVIAGGAGFAAALACRSHALSLANRASASSFDAAYEWESNAGWLFDLSALATGVGAGLLVALAWKPVTSQISRRLHRPRA